MSDDRRALSAAQIHRALDELYRGPVSHPLDQLANHMGAHCTCMEFFPQDPWIATHALAGGPMHPDDFARILRLRGAYCAHPQLAGWRLFELPLPQRVLVFPWPPALTDRELGKFLRREAARNTGHDVGLIAIDMPDRDCLRHRPAPREVAPR